MSLARIPCVSPWSKDADNTMLVKVECSISIELVGNDASINAQAVNECTATLPVVRSCPPVGCIKRATHKQALCCTAHGSIPRMWRLLKDVCSARTLQRLQIDENSSYTMGGSCRFRSIQGVVERHLWSRHCKGLWLSAAQAPVPLRRCGGPPMVVLVM